VTEFAADYGLFLAKSATLVVAIWLLIVVAARQMSHQRGEGRVEVTKINAKYDDMAQVIKREILSKGEFKVELKKLKRERNKDKRHSIGHRKRVFVLSFVGDMAASAVRSLREEVTAILMIARPEDEVFVRLESAGGLVHAYGLAASQLERICKKQLSLTIAVDKVAASGGYMMACVADRIIAAPFAIVGSIGVIAQLPNFNRFLKKHDIDFEQVMAGDYKRTLTLFGENTDAARQKMTEEIADTHALFKSYVQLHRPGVDIEEVANGEYWYGERALQRNLVDELMTSDDYLLEASKHSNLFQIRYIPAKEKRRRLLNLLPQSLRDLVKLPYAS